MSAVTLEVLDLLNNRLVQVASILDVLFLAGGHDSELQHNPQLIIDALWPARELLDQAIEAAGKIQVQGVNLGSI